MRRGYVAVFEPDDGGWSAFVSDLPGCFSDSETLKGAQSEIREAIILWLETAEKNGWPIPEPQSSAKLIAVSNLGIKDDSGSGVSSSRAQVQLARLSLRQYAMRHSVA